MITKTYSCATCRDGPCTLVAEADCWSSFDIVPPVRCPWGKDGASWDEAGGSVRGKYACRACGGDFPCRVDDATSRREVPTWCPWMAGDVNWEEVEK